MIRHTIITDFIVIYNLIPLSCFLVGIPNDCINSYFLRLNQLTCETPSMLRLKLPSLSSLSEHIVLSALKCWLNSREYSSPLMETSLNMHSFLITASPKFCVSRKNLMVGISFSAGKITSYKNIINYRIGCYAKHSRMVTNSPRNKKLSMAWGRKQVLQTEKLPKSECRITLFGRKNQSVCRSVVLT